jgi:citrate synthase
MRDRQSLLRACLAAHRASAERPNISSETLRRAFAGSGSYTSALAAALSTLGGLHAPLAATVSFLAAAEPWKQVKGALEAGQRIPGWGSSFAKGGKDPLWLEVDGILAAEFPELTAKIEAVTMALHQAGKRIYPNPSCYTAATALALGMHPALAPWIFVAGRLDAWTGIIAKELS